MQKPPDHLLRAIQYIDVRLRSDDGDHAEQLREIGAIRQPVWVFDDA